MKIKLGPDKYLEISTEKFEWFKYANDNANEFVDNYHSCSVQLGWVKFEYSNENYNKIIHCILDEDVDYKTNQQHLIDVLLASLRLWITSQTTMFSFESDYLKYALPFSFKYIVKDNGRIKCFITGPKEWFILHNLGTLLHQTYPDCYMSKEDIEYYFPNWKNKKEHNFTKINVKNS